MRMMRYCESVGFTKKDWNRTSHLGREESGTRKCRWQARHLVSYLPHATGRLSQFGTWRRNMNEGACLIDGTLIAWETKSRSGAIAATALGSVISITRFVLSRTLDLPDLRSVRVTALAW
nr:hypothetical protein CFP56_53591 [Quercus suber]